MEVEKTMSRRSSSASSSRTASHGTGTLERKNKDLNKATRELEAKMKNLQRKTRSLPRPASSASSTAPTSTATTSRSSSRSSSRAASTSRLNNRELPATPGADGGSRRGSTITSRIREREAEFQKQVSDRDTEIQRLKDRLKILSTKLTESKDKEAKLPKVLREKERLKQAKCMMEEGTELQNIIRQVTKERLQLERHLQIANDSLQRNNGVDLQKYLSLESTNHHLRQQLDSLDMLQEEYRIVEIQHREKEEACKELLNTLKYKSSLVEDLESQLAKVIEKNAELTIQNSDLQKKVVELNHVSDECQQLKNTLNQMESECVSAKSEVKSLSGKVRNLECVLDEMHKAAENRREIERQHKEALESLKRKQEEADHMATKKQIDIIEQLKIRIADLETERRIENERHQELILEMAELKRYGAGDGGESSENAGGASSTSSFHNLPPEIENPSDNIEIDEIMAKLEQDNKFLEEMEKQRAANKSDSPPRSERAGSAITDSGFLSQSSLNGGHSSSSPVGSGASNGSGGSSSSSGSGHHAGAATTGLTRNLPHHRSTLELPRLSGVDKINLLNGGSFSASALNMLPGATTFLGCRDVIIDKDGMVEIPGKGWCWVYVARYSYDPYQHSPNDTPEAELAINAGDYVLVWSDPDEDGFFDGEILDGRKGLVPSNFVERLEGDELIEFYQTTVLGVGDGEDSVCTSIPQDLDFISSDEGAGEDSSFSTKKKYFTSRKATLSHYYASCTDLDMTEDEEGCDLMEKIGGSLVGRRKNQPPPPPKHLTVENQLNKTVLVGWTLPEDQGATAIDCYEVLLDGVIAAKVLASEITSPAGSEHKTAKTVLNLDLHSSPEKLRRISVRSVIGNEEEDEEELTKKRTSQEASCTMLLGRDAPLGPTGLRAMRVTATSATVCWLPSNTNFLHTLCLNNMEVRTVKQGVHRHTVAGLAPNTVYKVTVRAKNIAKSNLNSYTTDRNVAQQLETLSAHLEIKTKPQGLPDPPLDVQVEVVKSSSSGKVINVMWLPVTIVEFGLSNGAPVSGYLIYADGKSVQDVKEPTADQAEGIVVPNDVKAITMKTKSGDKLSAESMPFLLTPDQHDVLEHTNGADLKKNYEEVKKESVCTPEKANLAQSEPFKFSEDEATGEDTEQGEEEDDDSDGDLMERLQAQPPLLRPRELIINYAMPPPSGLTAYPELDSDIGPSELSDIAEEPEDELTDEEEAERAAARFLSGRPGGVDALVNGRNNGHIYKANIVNAVTSWRDLHSDAGGPTAEPASSQSNKAAGVSSATSIANSQAETPHNSNLVRVNNSLSAGYNNGPNPVKVIDTTAGSSTIHAGHHINNNHKNANNMVAHVTTNNNHNVNNKHIVDNNQNSNQKPVSDPAFNANMTAKQSAASNNNNNNSNAVDNDRMRIFVALFDYDPPTMSPNPDACDEELPFREGQLIKVWGEKDGDGFYWGEAGGREGFVPCNMVSEVQVDDETVAEEIFKEQTPTVKVEKSSSSAAQPKQTIQEENDRWADIYEDMPIRRKLALYDYDPRELSPNVDSEVELSFRTGDIILIYGDMDEDGFYMGELGGQRGLVPSNFLTDVPLSYPPGSGGMIPPYGGQPRMAVGAMRAGGGVTVSARPTGTTTVAIGPGAGTSRTMVVGRQYGPPPAESTGRQQMPTNGRQSTVVSTPSRQTHNGGVSMRQNYKW